MKSASGSELAEARQRRTQAERSAETRRRLIDAAIDLLSRLGYAATSTVLVADNAGVSRGAMLHQFASKALLMAAVAEASVEADYAAYVAAIRDMTDPLQELMAIADVAWVQFRSPSGIAQTEIWMATRSDPELAAVVLPVHDAIYERSLRLQTQRYQRAGVSDPAIVRQVFYHNVALMRGLSLEHALGTPAELLAPAVEFMKQAELALIRAVRTEGSAR